MAANSTVQGLDALFAAMDQQLAAIVAEAPAALVAGQQVLMAVAQSNAPMETGALRNSMHIVSGQHGPTLTAKLIAGGPAAPYAIHEEFGTAPHLERPSSAHALAVGGQEYAEVHHPGARAKPFMRPALDSAGGAAVEAFATHLQGVVK